MKVFLRILAFVVVFPILLILAVSELLGNFLETLLEYTFTGKWNWEI